MKRLPAKKAAKTAAPSKRKPAAKSSPKPAPEATRAQAESLFLPYQLRYLKDRSRYKILEKSRRVGGTWAQSFEDVVDCIEQAGLKVWFSSADRSAGVEYIDYCKGWVRRLNAAATEIEVEQGALSEAVFADEEKGFKVTVLEFSNGSKIVALSSNPSAFRSKGGKIVWDEAAHHKADRDMWTAASHSAMWGHAIRILSTHNGKMTVFYRLIDRIKKGELKGWGHHCVTLPDAVKEGVADRIAGRPLSEAERQAFLDEERAKCIDEAAWLQECMCQAADEATAYITEAQIEACERPDLLGLDRAKGPLYLGMDVARRKHLSVIYLVELCGPWLHVRHLEVMRDAKFSKQRETLYALLRSPTLARACIDATGLGMQLAEEAREEFGVVESVTFTAGVKERLAIQLKNEFDDATISVPADKDQKTSIHSVKRIVTAANNVRFDAASDESNDHGDYFWALALAVHAARDPQSGPAWAQSTTPWQQQLLGFPGASITSWSGWDIPGMHFP